MKISGQLAPTANPSETIANLNKLPCHHFKVIGLNIVIT